MNSQQKKKLHLF